MLQEQFKGRRAIEDFESGKLTKEQAIAFIAECILLAKRRMGMCIQGDQIYVDAEFVPLKDYMDSLKKDVEEMRKIQRI